ncbi:type II 3-dehydroquinate dehydratase [Pelagibacterales bacterium SAG-MED31]|nr:type II 3-dehydroquinate dehydratase [Pelagibacterales bacterium SAG-MED31]
MKKILIINGPNLNLLGNREKTFYGDTTLEKIKSLCVKECIKNEIEMEFFQSNHEGELIEKIHSVENIYDGIIINPAAYTHTSIALLDALRATSKPKIEVHISNIYSREDYRRKSITSEAVNGIICGFGANGYLLAIEAMKKLIYNK